MKPIEVGCRVICVSVSDKGRETILGKVGTVIEQIPLGKRHIVDGITYEADTEVCWVVELDRTVRVNFGFLGNINIKRGAFRDRSLMRIDGDVDEVSEADEISKIKEDEYV